jgi:hypothetical protein
MAPFIRVSDKGIDPNVAKLSVFRHTRRASIIILGCRMIISGNVNKKYRRL